MTDHRSDPESTGIKGAVEDLKGRAKEAVGAVTGQDSLHREGQAQQDKAEAQQEMAEHESQADQAQRSAEAQEQRQRDAQ